MELLTTLTQHFRAVTGREPELLDVPAHSTHLPLYLRQTYDLCEARLFGHTILLALVKEGVEPEISERVKDWHNLTESLGANVALVLPHLKSYERKRLVEKHIPFIVPGRQMFLPMFLVDLREYFPADVAERPASVGWVAQIVLIRHLLKRDMENRPLASIAEALGYSAMAISQSVDQLRVLDLCRIVSTGRTKAIHFILPGKVLWKQSFSHLRSPVRKRYFVRRTEQAEGTWLRAGQSALADLTSLAAGPKEVWAMQDKAIRKMLAEGRVTACPDLEEAGGVVEGWAYRPERLSSHGHVDPFSLYLSLCDERDDRIQIALESLMESLS